MGNTLKSLKLTRKDGKVVDVIFYNNVGIENVEILDIKQLKFEGMKTKDIKKALIHNEVLKGEDKIYFQNKNSKMIAGLSKRHVNKIIISTIFTRDIESRHAYLKKELISNVGLIFYSAIPILKHPELKKTLLYDTQIIHRFALPIKIGGFIFFAIITVKERIDFKDVEIDEFTIYDLHSEVQQNKKSLDSSSKASVGEPMTFLSHYQVITYSINDLRAFVNRSITNFE